MTETEFWGHVLPQHHSGCWHYTGSLNRNGYGELRVDGRRELAHRFAYRRSVGPIPRGLYVLHSCDNPSCVNPAHLRTGTQAENIREAAEKGRLRNQNIIKTECHRGHLLAGENLRRDKDGRRRCLQCRREYSASHRAESREYTRRCRAKRRAGGG